MPGGVVEHLVAQRASDALLLRREVDGVRAEVADGLTAQGRVVAVDGDMEGRNGRRRPRCTPAQAPVDRGGAFHRRLLWVRRREPRGQECGSATPVTCGGRRQLCTAWTSRPSWTGTTTGWAASSASPSALTPSPSSG